MSTSLIQTNANSNSSDPTALNQTLTEIRSGRRLTKVVSSIESFLNSQINRIETSLEQIQAAAHNDTIVQNILAEFEANKANWENQRTAEIERLKAAGDRLAEGWMQLEDERRKLLDQTT